MEFGHPLADNAPEVHMIRTLLVCSILLCLGGCERSSKLPLDSDPPPTSLVTIIRGFDNGDTAIVGTDGMRLNAYYNFKLYDSLTVSFTAKRLILSSKFDHLIVKLGPGYCLYDSLSAAQKNFTFAVKTSEVAKPQSAALSFFVQDPETSVLLSKLIVTGWLAH
jgi:hypothetical protein